MSQFLGNGRPERVVDRADGGRLGPAVREHVAAALAEEAGEEPGAPADDRLRVRLVGEAEARQEAVLRRLVQAAGAVDAREQDAALDAQLRHERLQGGVVEGRVARLDRRLDGLDVVVVEAGDALVVPLGERRLDLVAQAEVQGQLVAHAPVVLHEEAPGLGVLGVVRGPEDRRRGGHPEEERGVVLQALVVRAAGAALPGVGVREGVLAGLGVGGGEAVLAVDPHLHPALQRVGGQHLVQGGDDRVRGGRPEVVAVRHVDHGGPVEVEAREVPVDLGNERVVLRGESQLSSGRSSAPPPAGPSCARSGCSRSARSGRWSG